MAKWRKEILNDVTVVPKIGTPGRMVIFGDKIEPILTTSNSLEILIAAAEYGKGRAIIIPHDGYVTSFLSGNSPGHEQLFKNFRRWLSRNDKNCESPKFAQNLDLIDDMNDLHPECKLLVWKLGKLRSEKFLNDLKAFIAKGNGIFIASCPWGYMQVFAGQTLQDMPCYGLFKEIGVCYTSNYMHEGASGINVSENKAEQAHFLRIVKSAEQNPDNLTTHGNFIQGSLAQMDDHAMSKVMVALNNTLAALQKDGSVHFIPSKHKPVNTPQGKALMIFVSKLSSFNKKKLPGINIFPGDIGLVQLTTSYPITYYSNTHDWIHPTGYFLPAGQTLIVHVSNGDCSGWQMQVGSHTDDLSHKDSLRRWPVLCAKENLKDGLQIFSPCGGLVYLRNTKKGQVTVNFDNVIPAPYYNIQIPETGRDWHQNRNNAGLWGDLVGRHVIITLPTSTLCKLADPEKVVVFYDQLIESYHWLRTSSVWEKMRDWIVADEQPVAGYMHAGYPIVTMMDMADWNKNDMILNVDFIKSEGNWGLFHEIGHNMQRPLWTWRSATEVTVNIFSYFGMRQIVGHPKGGVPWINQTKPNRDRFIQNGANWNDWQKDPLVGIGIFLNIMDAFGWEMMRAFFRTYEAEIEKKNEPTLNTDQEKIDEAFVRLCRSSGHDLSQIFKFWGLPLSSASMAKVSKFPPKSVHQC